jgi:Xaa-Pro aminopeptidase
VVILAAGTAPVRTSDERYRFFAYRNFCYLTGIEQEGSNLVLLLELGVTRSFLFIPAGDALQERWNGRRLTRTEAAERSGLTDVSYIEGFAGQLADLIARRSCHLYLDYSAENAQAAALKNQLAQEYPQLSMSDVGPLLTQLRMIKQQEELDLIREAALLTGEGILSAMRACRPASGSIICGENFSTRSARPAAWSLLSTRLSLPARIRCVCII